MSALLINFDFTCNILFVFLKFCKLLFGSESYDELVWGELLLIWSFRCASVIFTFDMIKLGLAGWGVKAGPGRSRQTVLGLGLCCGGDLNNTVSHFINTLLPSPPSALSPGPRGIQLQERLNEILFFKMSRILKSDANLRCRNWKSQHRQMHLLLSSRQACNIDSGSEQVIFYVFNLKDLDIVLRHSSGLGGVGWGSWL